MLPSQQINESSIPVIFISKISSRVFGDKNFPPVGLNFDHKFNTILYYRTDNLFGII